jgi:hypothetical protein
MWTKIFAAIMGLSTAVMAFFTYYSWSWLQSIGSPAAAASGYEYHSEWAWMILLISSSVLLVLANAVYWTSIRLWALWATFGYFAVFIALRYFWLEPSFFVFRKDNSMIDAAFSAKPLLAVILIIVMAAIVFADQLIVIRLRAKAYPEPVETEETAETHEPETVD